jgi:hypothetical protein
MIGLTAFLSLATLAVIMTALFVLSMPFSLYGLQFRIKKIKLRERMGLLWIQSKANAFGLPHIVNIDEPTITIGDKEFVAPEGSFDGPKFFGCHVAMFPSTDTKNPIGLYYQETNKNGEPLFNDDGSASLSAVKPAVGLDPGLFKAVTTTAALTKFAKKLFNQYKTQIIILGAIAVGIGISLYLNYEAFSTLLPGIQESLDTIANACVDEGVSVAQGTVTK